MGSIRFFRLMAVCMIAFLSVQPVIAKPISAPSPYDLIAEVNAFRSGYGLYALNPESHVMSAAQAHAEWIVETGQGGHTGAGGSDETIRVMWSGYGGGASVHCDEAWASTSSVYSAVYEAWNDPIHHAVMLDGWGNGYTDVGAGIADNGNGSYVFVLDVCMVSGKPSANRPTAYFTPGSGEIAPTEDFSEYIMGVLVTTPAADGSITHIVDYGQTLVQIALAYGVKVAEIRQLNGMAADSTLIYPEQILIIKSASSTLTPIPPTSSPIVPVTPTKTSSPRTNTPRPSPTITPTPTPKPLGDLFAENLKFDQKTIGIFIITICGAGLIFFLANSFKQTESK